MQWLAQVKAKPKPTMAIGKRLQQLAAKRHAEQRKRRDLLVAGFVLFAIFGLIGMLTSWWELGYGFLLAGFGCIVAWSILKVTTVRSRRK